MELFLHTFDANHHANSDSPLFTGINTSSFSYSSETELLHILDEVIATETARTLRDTWALVTPDNKAMSPMEALQATTPFNTFYARHKYPWLLSDLTPYVQMHYQPIVDFNQSGKVFGFEALCRLKTPEGKWLNGMEAFALAAEVKRTHELDLACQQLALIGKSQSISADKPIFINVLPQTIMSPDWLDFILKILNQQEIDKRDVVIEIVESEKADPEVLARYCDEIRRHGLRIALDDMGSGFNGLRILAEVRADFIKIDRAIVHEAQGSRVRTVLLEAIISMAQRLGCTIIAEGLERVEDITYCQDLGLHYAQGHYFAYPQSTPSDKVTALPVRDESHRSHVPDDFHIGEYISHGLTIDVSSSLAEARRLFNAHADIANAVVLDGQKPLGVLRRGKVFSKKHTGLGACCDPLPKVINHMLPSLVLARIFYLERGNIDIWIMVNDEGGYMGVL
jgi:EAL domain-containing protein (putative c-di-GMP-specific phosphodiesterase class I)